LPAAVLDFGVGLLGHFRGAGWFGGFKQASYLMVALYFKNIIPEI